MAGLLEVVKAAKHLTKQLNERMDSMRKKGKSEGSDVDVNPSSDAPQGSHEDLSPKSERSESASLLHHESPAPEDEAEGLLTSEEKDPEEP